MSVEGLERRAADTALTHESAKIDNLSGAIIPRIKPNTKLYRVLSGLLERSYNLFEAATELHDRSLHSTVSTIQNGYGIRVDRRTETVPGYQGRPTQCCRYWITPDQHERALRVLGAEL